MRDKKALERALKPYVQCHDCGVREGEIHEPGCDMESCPFCGGQLLSCECSYDEVKDYEPCLYLSKEGIEELSTRSGISKEDVKKIDEALLDAQYEKWDAVLEEKGRIPYIMYPNMCARCGELWPDMFTVPTEEWEHYIEPRIRGEQLCRECYDEIKGIIDRHDQS